MGRRKVRHYKPREYYRDLLETYFKEHQADVMSYVLFSLNFDSVREMQNEERTGIWCDCGWILITPCNTEQAHEWYLDNDRVSSNLYVHNPYYNTQSTTIKELMVRHALHELGLEDEFSVSVRLD